MSRDPIEEDGGLNLYAFTLNSPLLYSDILGLFAGQIDELIQSLVCGRSGYISFPLPTLPITTPVWTFELDGTYNFQWRWTGETKEECINDFGDWNQASGGDSKFVPEVSFWSQYVEIWVRRWNNNFRSSAYVRVAAYRASWFNWGIDYSAGIRSSFSYKRWVETCCACLHLSYASDASVKFRERKSAKAAAAVLVGAWVAKPVVVPILGELLRRPDVWFPRELVRP